MTGNVRTGYSRCGRLSILLLCVGNLPDKLQCQQRTQQKALAAQPGQGPPAARLSPGEFTREPRAGPESGHDRREVGAQGSGPFQQPVQRP